MPQETSTALPRRSPRALEAAQFLRERLAAGNWPRQLPGELALAAELQVGRNTIRAALALLQAEGLVRTQVGKRRQATGAAQPTTTGPGATAVLVLGMPYHALASSTLLWMEALRLRLAGTGWRLHIRVESAAYGRSPEPILENLILEHPSAVWILHRSTAAMQHWFEKRGLRAVIAGSQHPGVSLPQVDTDYRAVSRHAAARLTTLGHKHLMILASQQQLAGDEESLLGFQEGAGRAEIFVIRHNDTPQGVIASLRQAMSSRPAPTGLFILRAEHFATALTWLQQQGHLIPAHVSLISRDDEPFLQHLYPEPARYQRSPETFAKRLARLVTTCADGSPARSSQPLLMPDFIRGGTTGPISKR